MNEVLFSVEATYCYCAQVQSLTNLHVMLWPVAQLRDKDSVTIKWQVVVNQ